MIDDIERAIAGAAQVARTTQGVVGGDGEAARRAVATQVAVGVVAQPVTLLPDKVVSAVKRRCATPALLSPPMVSVPAMVSAPILATAPPTCQFSNGLPLLEQALPHFRQQTGTTWRVIAEHRLANTWLRLGQPARAHQALRPLPDDARAGGHVARAIVLARLAAWAGQPAEA